MKTGRTLRGLVIGFAILAGSLGVGVSGAGAKTAVVPWSDETVTSALLQSLEPKPLPVPPPKTDAPPCRSSALSLEPATSLQWMQNGGVAIRFRNVGSAACLLRGTPFVVATSPGHASIVATKLGLAETDSEVADTPVGATVYVDVSAPVTCAADPGGNEQGLPVYRGLVIKLPGGDERTVTGLHLSLPCGLAVTPFNMPIPAPTYPRYWLASLVPHIELPHSIRAGRTLEYLVTLHDPLNRPVSLSPCPAYIEQSSSNIELEYRFNCSDVHAVPAHGAVTYRMKMAIPRSTSSGPLKVYWSVIGPNTIQARASVDVH